MMSEESLKPAVAEFWEQASCGEVYATGDEIKARLEAQARARYAMEPYIFSFARFPEAAGKDVLEIGVGMGADHLEWAKTKPRTLQGIDLTDRAVEFTRTRLALHGFEPNVRNADAERLPFANESFDVVYSWGVLHHSPNTAAAIEEVWRVLRPGGRASIMVYHRASVVGWLLWIRYALLAGRPGTSLDEIYARYLESPGTKAYSEAAARQLFARFSAVRTSIELSNGDLLEGEAGQRHQGAALRLARRIWPRGLIRRYGKRYGLFLLIEAIK
jgi:ubiquinone/menaquinone biosynthesis C-methylase UbiE